MKISFYFIILIYLLVNVTFAENKKVNKDQSLTNPKSKIKIDKKYVLTNDYMLTECEGNEKWMFQSSNNNDEQILIPPNGGTCIMKKSYDDDMSADMAMQDLERKLTELAARYSGNFLGGYEEIEDGELVKAVYIKAYMKIVNPYIKIYERGMNYNKNRNINMYQPWYIKVEFKARINKMDFNTVVKELVNEVTNNKMIIDDLKKEIYYLQTELKTRKYNENQMSRIKSNNKNLLRKYQELKDYFDWYKFNRINADINSLSHEQKLKQFTNSTNPIVKKESRIKHSKYIIDKYNIKNTINTLISLLNSEDSAFYRNKLGVAYWKAEYGLHMAEEEFRKALKLNPDKDLNRKIIYNLATVLGIQGKFNESLTLLDALEDINKEGKILRSTIRSRYTQKLVCQDLREACGNNKGGICQNWELALTQGDCLETGEATVKKLSNNSDM